MDNARKKNMLREYKEAKQRAGVFAVSCGEQRWIGVSRNLDKQQNSVWFQLRSGGFPNKAVQDAWNAQSESAFAYEVVEEVTDDNPLIIGELLKERAATWREEMGAGKLVG
ncbi:MAG TPA: GIY-YIG nuclease family protein [Rhizomicrobium sp.]|jgi:hypothetical protein